MEGCSMRFERLTDLGPQGAQRFWGSCPKTPEQLGAAFGFSRIRIELPTGANDLCDDCAVHSTVCYVIFFALSFCNVYKIIRRFNCYNGLYFFPQLNIYKRPLYGFLQKRFSMFCLELYEGLILLSDKYDNLFLRQYSFIILFMPNYMR